MPSAVLEIESHTAQSDSTWIERIDSRIVRLWSQVSLRARQAFHGSLSTLGLSASSLAVFDVGGIGRRLGPSIADVTPFIRAFVSDPRRVGAVAPSGRALAEAIAAEIRPDSAPVIELGPGSGAFTQQILERGVPEDRLALIEFGPDFAHSLRLRYPHARVLRMDANRLRHVELFSAGKAGAVVSGLPFLSMSILQRVRVLDGAFRHLRADGAFYQFTYGPRCPVPRVVLERLGLKATRIGGTFANLPPASVYRITRRPPRHDTWHAFTWSPQRSVHA